MFTSDYDDILVHEATLEVRATNRCDGCGAATANRGQINVSRSGDWLASLFCGECKDSFWENG